MNSASKVLKKISKSINKRIGLKTTNHDSNYILKSDLKNNPTSVNPSKLREYGQNIVKQIPLYGDHVYSDKDAELISNLLKQDSPSKYIDDPFYWPWFNARRAISTVAWDSFIASVFIFGNNKASNSPITKKGLLTDCLDKTTLEEFDKLYHTIPVKQFDGDDFIPGYFFDPNMTAIISRDRDIANEFRKPTEELLKAIESWLHKERLKLENMIGHSFRITTVRLFSLKPGNTEFGADHWHLDAYVFGMKKLQIYLGPTGLKDGSTEFRLKDGSTTHIEGQPGTWGIFENTMVYHRALPPNEKPRPTIELSIAPSLVTDCSCIDAGMNSGFRWFPPEFSADKNDKILDSYVKALEVKFYISLIFLLSITNGFPLLPSPDIPRRFLFSPAIR
jgi:hypothetical protein